MQQQQQAPAMQVMQQHAARGMQRQAMQVTHHGGLAAPVDNVVMKTKLTPRSSKLWAALGTASSENDDEDEEDEEDVAWLYLLGDQPKETERRRRQSDG